MSPVSHLSITFTWNYTVYTNEILFSTSVKDRAVCVRDLCAAVSGFEPGTLKLFVNPDDHSLICDTFYSQHLYGVTPRHSSQIFYTAASATRIVNTSLLSISAAEVPKVNYQRYRHLTLLSEINIVFARNPYFYSSTLMVSAWHRLKNQPSAESILPMVDDFLSSSHCCNRGYKLNN